MNRNELQAALIDRIIDGMDVDSLCQLAAEYLEANYTGYTDDQIEAEAAEYYPDLLGE